MSERDSFANLLFDCRNMADIQKKRNLTLEEKRIVFKLNKKFRGLCSSQNDVVKIIMGVMDCSKATVFRVLKQGVPTPVKKSTGRKSIIKTLDDFDKSEIRKIVQSFYLKKQKPTLNKLHPVINNNAHLPNMCRTTIYNFLRELNIVHTERERNCLLIEKQYIIQKRRQYLDDINAFRLAGKKIYYLDEIWLGKGCEPQATKPRDQTNGISTSTEKPPEAKDAGGLLLLHICGEAGFVSGCMLTMEVSNADAGDSVMTPEIFEAWFRKVLDKIGPDAVVVMDNAERHSRKLEIIPMPSSSRETIVEWLKSKNANFNDAMSKADLLSVVRSLKDSYDTTFVDEIAKQRGNYVVRLPAFHTFLSPLHSVRSYLKSYITLNNTNWTPENIKKLLLEGLEKVGTTEWQSLLDQVRKEEQELVEVDKQMSQIARQMAKPKPQNSKVQNGGATVSD